MKKNIFKQVKNTLPLCAMVATVGFTACTSDFESINTDPNGIPAEEVLWRLVSLSLSRRFI